MSENHPGSLERQTRNLFKDWLEKLQQESWQLELVISSIALYLVYEARDYIEDFAVYAEIHGDTFDFPIFEFAQFLLEGGLLIFMINLIVHILGRGFWIGTVGLRFVSGEADFHSLNYSEIFEKHLEQKVGKFDNFIERLERFCSILYAYTFLLFFIFVSILAYVLFLLGLIQIITELTRNLDDGERGIWLMVVILPYIIFGMIYAIDVIFMGAFKRIREPAVSRIYFYIYRFFNVITLAFFYRSLVYNFIDNAYSRRFIWFSIPYFLLIFIIIPSSEIEDLGYFPTKDHCNQCTSESLINWQFYDDLRTEFLNNNPKTKKDETIIKYGSLSAFEITKVYADIFIAMNATDDRYLEKVLNVQKLRHTGFRTLFQDTWARDTVKEEIDRYFELLILDKLKLKKQARNAEEKAMWQFNIDSIKTAQRDSLVNYEQELGRRRVDAFKSMVRVYVDSIEYTDSLSCHWYIHPNQGEKGILCRFSARAINDGHHIMRIERQKHYERNGDDNSKKDTFYIDKYVLPFFRVLNDIKE